MSTALVHNFPVDNLEALFQNPPNSRNGQFNMTLLNLLTNNPEAAGPILSSLQGRSRNSSGSSCSSSSNSSSTSSSMAANNQYTPSSPVPMISYSGDSAGNSPQQQPHLRGSDVAPVPVPQRKLDRSMSEPAPMSSPDRTQNQKSVNSSRYKTELCRPFEENGFCKYGDKCQFAHGENELRNLNRHPKYKTERCRTFHSTGFCPYGPRCHFIHNEDERKLSHISHLKHQQQQFQAVQQLLAAQVPSQVPPPPSAAPRSPPQNVSQPRAVKALNFSNLSLPPMVRDSLGSTADSPPSSLRGSPTLSPMMTEDFLNGSMFSGSSNSSTPPPQSAPPGFHGSAFPAFQPPTQAEQLSSMLTPPAAPLTPPNMSPLKVQTHHHCDPLVSLAAGIQAASLQSDTDVLKDCLPASCGGEVFPTYMPPSPPRSLDEPLMDTPPTPTSVVPTTPGSPLDLGRQLRLPIFSRMSTSEDH